tara:strand:- start:467 stop:997 length:531 start_codon:yes stop_codon:yes gene_type:complete
MRAATVAAVADPAQLACRRVVFLDVDGVLHPQGSGNALFQPGPMRRLHRIVTSGDAAVCLSSSWRSSDWGVDEVNAQLERAGLACIVGITPTHGFATRSDEILHWLSQHPETEHFVALDDMDLTYPHGDSMARHFVHVDEERGLTDADAEAALACLKRPVDRSTLPTAQTRDEAIW